MFKIGDQVTWQTRNGAETGTVTAIDGHDAIINGDEWRVNLRDLRFWG